MQLGRNVGMLKLHSAVTSMTHPVRLTKSYHRADSYHPQPVSRLYMDHREAASQGCYLVSSRTTGGTYDRLVSGLYHTGDTRLL